MICVYCNRVCKNHNSHRNHERLCKSNPNHQLTHFSNSEFKANNKVTPKNQYTKARELGLPVPVVKQSTRDKISLMNKQRDGEWHRINGQKISKTVNEKVARGEWHTSLAKNMHYEYKGNDLHGTWELKYAQWLDLNNITWVRNKDSFEYVYDGVVRRYTPDFYLTETSTYVEIKGFATEKDFAKWAQFPVGEKLVVLKDADLKTLGVL